jgi:F-type H+-transporting ATPase subunit delta
MRRESSLCYAKALFTLLGADEVQENDAHVLGEVLEHSPSLRKFFAAPQISRKAKEKVLRNSLQDKVSPALLRFVLFLLSKGKLNLLPQITEEYRRIFNAQQGVLTATLVTAVPSTASQQDAFKSKLASCYQKKIHLQTIVDKSIIGGAKLIIANHMIDGSLQSRLERMRARLQAIQI